MCNGIKCFVLSKHEHGRTIYLGKGYVYTTDISSAKPFGKSEAENEIKRSCPGWQIVPVMFH